MFSKKFELILSHVVSSPLRGSLLQRGAPTRRASVIFCARDFLALRARSSDNFNLVLVENHYSAS